MNAFRRNSAVLGAALLLALPAAALADGGSMEDYVDKAADAAMYKDVVAHCPQPADYVDPTGSGQYPYEESIYETLALARLEGGDRAKAAADLRGWEVSPGMACAQKRILEIFEGAALDGRHLSDDQKVLDEMLRQQRATHDTARQTQLAHIKAEAERGDALTVEVKDDGSGSPRFYITNHTDVSLDFSLEFKLIVDDKPVDHVPVSFVVGPGQTTEQPYQLGEHHTWEIPAVHATWSADKSNYEGSWNTPMQGG